MKIAAYITAVMGPAMALYAGVALDAGRLGPSLTAALLSIFSGFCFAAMTRRLK